MTFFQTFLRPLRHIAAGRRAQAAEREQRILAEALRDTAAALASTASFDEVLDRILAVVGRVVPHETASIMLIEDGIARVTRHRGYVERGLTAPLLALRFAVADVPNMRQMAATGQPFIIADTKVYPGWVDIPETRWVRSYVGAPIRIKGQAVGFLNLNSATPGFFTAGHAESLLAFADQAGVAIDNAQLYDEVRRYAAELEQRVAERTAELVQREAALQAANEKLRELDRLKSQFVTNVSHELRTPLTNITLMATLIERGKPEKRAQYLATLYREIGLLTALIEDLLYLSRMDAGKNQPALAELDLNQIVGNLAGDRAALLADRGLQLQTDLAPDLPPVRADAKMVTQVLTNLMTNAMNYTPVGGTITVRTRLERGGEGADERGGEGVTEHAARSTQHAIRNTWVTFSVSDTGPGITAEERVRLFERFYRGEAGRASGASGTGLGLSICQEIVQRHNGRITVESEPGQGSTFTVWLPVG
ncbi:MAG: ATP-binding protein [Chloroflexi bacterium]|nr:ATP-binding protein [Chloroflexota bacterium]